MNEVLIACGSNFANNLVKYFNPLELKNVHKEWLHEPILSGSNVIDHNTFIETEFNKSSWYANIPEPGKNPYKNYKRIGEHFGNYLYALSKLVRCPIPYDRTDEFNILNVHIDPIPNVPHNWNRTFEEIFLERAEEIWAIDKPIRLWWSGGIDSTTALISLLRTKKPEHKLIIFMGDPCIEENPNFYETLKKMESNKELTIQWNDKHNIWSFDNWCDGTINVTGEPADPFYGTFVVKDHIDEINSPWTDLFRWEDSNYIFKGDDYSCEYHRPKFMEFAENFNKKCPFEVRNTFDFTWWLAFSIKWQWIVNRIYIQLDNPSNYKNMISFYNCPEFQRWSIVNHDLKHKGSWETYKWPSKEFIYNYNKDADYRDNKLKENSLKKTVAMNGSVSAPSSLIMTSGDYYKKTKETTYGIKGLDPEIAFINKWDIFNEPLWKKWQNML